MAFEKSVKTANGVRKLVYANTEEELAEAVAAVKAEARVEAPDITNPEHGNLHADMTE